MLREFRVGAKIVRDLRETKFVRAALTTALLLLGCNVPAQAFNGNIVGGTSRDTFYQDTTTQLNQINQVSRPGTGAAAADDADAGTTNFTHGDAPGLPGSGNFSAFPDPAKNIAPSRPGAPITASPQDPASMRRQRSRQILQSASDANARRLLFATAARIDEAAMRPFDRVLLTADVSDEAAHAAMEILHYDRVSNLYRDEKPVDHSPDWWEHRAVLAALVLQETIDLPNRAAALPDMNAAANLFADGAVRMRAMSADFIRYAGLQVPSGCETTRDELVRFAETVNVLLDAEGAFIDGTRTQPNLSLDSIPGRNAMGAIRRVMLQQSIASKAAAACTKQPDTIAIFTLQQALQAMRVVGDVNK